MASKSNELRIIRVFDAPVKAVWAAWTEPDQVAQWWGPRGFTITTHSKDLRAGGHWNYTMHGPDGTDYPNKTVYLEVEKHARLVYDHGGNDERAPLFRVTVTFAEEGGKTTMDMRMTLPTAEAMEETRQIIKKAGGNSTWDRLAEFLEEKTHGKEAFVISRSFDAPIEVMFDMWTKPEHFSRWLGPTGSTMAFIECDIRTGGSGFFSMTMQGGGTMYGKLQYRDIQKPGRIVYTQQFCDAKGNLSRHPAAPLWPETMLTTVTLAEEGPGETRVTIVWEPYGNVTAEEVKAFTSARAGMTQGWTGSFEKLEALLAAR